MEIVLWIILYIFFISIIFKWKKEFFYEIFYFVWVNTYLILSLYLLSILEPGNNLYYTLWIVIFFILPLLIIFLKYKFFSKNWIIIENILRFFLLNFLFFYILPIFIILFNIILSSFAS